jgi:hypothetical protein
MHHGREPTRLRMSSSDYIAIAGVAANLMVVLAAILVPVWQRRAMLSDTKEAERKAWNRFIEAFRALAAAQDAVVAAGKMERSAKAFEAAEPELRGATEALAEASATTLPIKAVINSTKAQQEAAAMLARFPDLKIYGSNLMTYELLQSQMNDARDATYLLLNQTESLMD